MLPSPLEEDDVLEADLIVATALSKSMVDGSTFCTATPPGFRCCGDQLVELGRQQVERDEGSAIGVDQDDVERLVGAREPDPAVLDLDVEVLLRAHVEEFVGESDDLGVELDGGHLQVGHRLVMVPGGAAAAEADDRGVVEAARIGEARRSSTGCSRPAGRARRSG